MKKNHKVILAVCAVSLLMAIPSYAAQWKQDSTGWRYEKEQGSDAVSEWKQVDGSWYYFDGQGYMVTGWFQDGATWYYLSQSGAMLHDTTQNIDGTNYTFGSNGAWVNGQAQESAVSSAGIAEVKQWFYNTYAILANESDWNGEYFKADFGTDMNEAKYRMKNFWSITDKQSAKKTIEWLKTSGHRVGYQSSMQLYNYLGMMDLGDAELRQAFTDAGASSSQIDVELDMIRAYKNGGEGAVDGWDYCREMQVIRESYMAGYLNETEYMDMSRETAKRIQNRFSSWDDMAESYCRGYEYWSGSRYSYNSRKNSYENIKAKENSTFLLDWNLGL